MSCSLPPTLRQCPKLLPTFSLTSKKLKTITTPSRDTLDLSRLWLGTCAPKFFLYLEIYEYTITMFCLYLKYFWLEERFWDNTNWCTWTMKSSWKSPVLVWCCSLCGRINSSNSVRFFVSLPRSVAKRKFLSGYIFILFYLAIILQLLIIFFLLG